MAALSPFVTPFGMFLLCWCVQSVLAAKHCSSHGGGNFVEGLTFANGTTFEVPKKCTSLDLSYNDLGPQHAVKLAAALEGSKVESLIISHNKLQDEGLKALLPVLSKLKELDIQHNFFTKAAASSLGTLLTDGVTLESLNVKANHDLGDEGVSALLKAAGSHSKLKFLSLVDTGLTHTSAPLVSALLGENSALQILELKGNSFDCQGVEHIAEGLGKNSGLKELHLAGNPISNAGATALAKAIKKNGNLEEVNIKACYVDDEETLMEMKYSLRKNQGIPDYQIELERKEETLANAKRRAGTVDESIPTANAKLDHETPAKTEDKSATTEQKEEKEQKEENSAAKEKEEEKAKKKMNKMKAEEKGNAEAEEKDAAAAKAKAAEENKQADEARAAEEKDAVEEKKAAKEKDAAKEKKAAEEEKVEEEAKKKGALLKEEAEAKAQVEAQAADEAEKIKKKEADNEIDNEIADAEKEAEKEAGDK